jgi:chaperone modulatory protein CbpM
MTQEFVAVAVDEALLSFDELTVTCAVSFEWVIEHVQAGVLLEAPDPDVSIWKFSGRDLRRARRIRDLERTFDAGPELAGLVVDLLEETERLRARLRRAGLSID